MPAETATPNLFELFLESELVEVVNRCDPSYTVFILINVFTVRH